MIATATLVIGIVREVMRWPSLPTSSLLRELAASRSIAGVIPGKHTTRKGWLTKDFHYPQSPFTANIDAALWRDARRPRSLAAADRVARLAWFFRKSIRRDLRPVQLSGCSSRSWRG